MVYLPHIPVTLHLLSLAKWPTRQAHTNTVRYIDHKVYGLLFPNLEDGSVGLGFCRQVSGVEVAEARLVVPSAAKRGDKRIILMDEEHNFKVVRE